MHKGTTPNYTKYSSFALIRFTIYHCSILTVGGDIVKRVICILLVAILLIIPFSVTAFAGVEENLIGFFLDWFVGTSIDVGYGDMSADEIIDFYNTPAGHAFLDVFDYGSTPGMFVDLHEYVDTANDKRAWAMKTNADGIQQLYDNINGFLEWKNTTIRTNDLSDFGLSTYNEIITGGLYTSGPGPVIGNFDDGKSYYMNLRTPINDGCIYIYPGSSIYFPVIYVPDHAKLYQSGNILPTDSYYLPLGYNRLICISAASVKFRLMYSTGATIDSITFYASNIYGDKDTFDIYQDGTIIGQTNTTVSGFDCVDLLQKMVGVHIDPNGDGAFYQPADVPEDIPYDDNGDVVISIPYGGGSPTYISYNDYINNIDNGTYNTDNSINYGDYYDDSVANTIINNYYNYGTGGGDFDDTNILNRLDKIIDKLDVLDDIKKKLNDISKAIKDLEFPEVEPCYANFSDCITTNIPLIGAIKDSIGSMDETVASNPSNAGFDFNVESSSSSKLPVSSGSSGSWTDKIRVNIDMSWYGPYADDIRNVLKLGVYVCGLYGIWRSVLSVFGIRTL